MKRILIWLLIISFVVNINAVSSYASTAADLYQNIAVDKPSWSSNQLSNTYSAVKVNDGDIKSIYSSGKEQLSPPLNGYEYIAVDLEEICDIYKVVVRSRRDLDQTGSRAGWVIQGANKADFSDAIEIGKKVAAGEFGEDLTAVFSKPKKFRYIRVCKNGSMVIAEIEVYGEVSSASAGGFKEHPDITDPKLKNAVRLLEYLQVFENEDLNYPDNLVTRDEALQLAVNSAYTNPFSQDDEVADNVKYREFAYRNGLIDSAGNFNGENYISIAEFLKIVLCSMGYGDYIKAKGGFPTGVYAAAREVDLYYSGYATEGYLSKAIMAKIMYDALLTQKLEVNGIRQSPSGESNLLYERNGNLLEKAFGIKIYEGIVTQNSYTTLTEATTIGKNEIFINYKPYVDESGNLHSHIGEHVQFLQKTNDEGIILSGWRDETKTKCYEFPTDRLSGIDSNNISFYTDAMQRNKEEFSLAETVYVMKNGEAWEEYTPYTFKSSYGVVELVDNNNDRKIEVIKIKEPQIIQIDNVFYNEDEIVITGLKGTNIVIKDYDYINAEFEGKSVSPNVLPKGALLYIYVSDSGKYVELEAYNKTVSGSVTAVADNLIEISGKEFYVSKYFAENYSDISIGKSALFLMNRYDEIVIASDIGFNKENEKVGVILKTAVSKGLSCTVSMKIFEEDGSFKILECADKIILDGERITNQLMSKKLKENPEFFTLKLAKYRLNSVGKIISLDTENYNADAEPESNLINMGIELTSSDKKHKNGFYSKYSLVVPTKDDLPVFVLPFIDNEPADEDEFKNYYYVSTMSKVFPNNRYAGSNISFYSADEYGYPEYTIKFTKIRRRYKDLREITSNSAPGLVIDKIMFSKDENEEDCYTILGTELATGKNVRLMTSSSIQKIYETNKMLEAYSSEETPEELKPESSWFSTYKLLVPTKFSDIVDNYISDITTLKRGDIVRYELSDGKISALERVYRRDENSEKSGIIYAAGDSYAQVNATFRLMAGEVKLCENGIIKVDAGFDEVFLSEGLQSVVIVDKNGSLTSCKLKEIPFFVRQGDKTVYYVKTGIVTSLIIYR